MTVLKQFDTDAASTVYDWHSISWAECHQQVRKLQVRIAKATREKRWRKVKALQWLLTHSFSAKSLAVKRVTENQGKKTPGVDGETWSTPKAKAEGIRGLKRVGYKPQPLRRVYIPKSDGSRRPLGIPTMKDRAMQALHLLALEPVSETTADWNSYGFRPERATRDAIGQLFVVLSRKDAVQWVLEGDIKGCFDNISHRWMLENICTDTKVLERWLKAGYVENRTLFQTNAGTPQGGIISPVLSNLVLDGLEDLLGKKFGSRKLDGHNSRVSRFKVHFVRYADDFVITGNSKELLETKVMPMVREFLVDRGLSLSATKTKITHISEGFDFLGQQVRKYHLGKPNEKLLIKPSNKNVKAFLHGVRETISKFRGSSQEALIRCLNPKIVGWANYHKHVVATETFATVDYRIWHALWNWAKRRHPMKSGRWVRQRYFDIVGSRSYVFRCLRKLKDGSKGWYELRKASDVAIVRHTKIQGEAQPYDPTFEEYFEKRLSVKMASSLKGRTKLLYLWKDQDGLCPVCGEALTEIKEWHAHHLVRRVDGGSDASSNLYLLHPNCHRQHHANHSLKWKKPVEEESLI
jgi:RNA-directed DNA polymerase